MFVLCHVDFLYISWIALLYILLLFLFPSFILFLFMRLIILFVSWEEYEGRGVIVWMLPSLQVYGTIAEEHFLSPLFSQIWPNPYEASLRSCFSKTKPKERRFYFLFKPAPDRSIERFEVKNLTLEGGGPHTRATSILVVNRNFHYLCNQP